MMALRLHGPGRLVLEAVPEPVPGPDEAVFQVTCCAVCRTDAKMWQAGHRDLILPRILGHEICAEGEDGNRYAVWPGTACGRCDACRRGAENLCSTLRIIGFHRDGGFAERVAAPRRNLLPVPSGVPDAVACLAEPLACALNGLEQARVGPGDRLLIYGAGPVGLLAGLAARYQGAESAVREIRPARLAESRLFRERVGMGECGADAAGFDAALNAAPDGAILSDALDRLRPGGRFVLFSGFTSGVALPIAGLNRIHYRQLTLAGAYGCTRDGVKNALQILAKYPTEAALLVAEAGTLAQGPALLPAILEGRGLRRVIRPG